MNVLKVPLAVRPMFKYDREHDFDIIRGQVVLFHKVILICPKHSNNVTRQNETLGDLTIPVKPQIHQSAVNGNLYMPTSHLFTEQRSLSYAGSKLWNEIPFEIRNADSLNSFKTNFRAYLLTH